MGPVTRIGGFGVAVLLGLILASAVAGAAKRPAITSVPGQGPPPGTAHVVVGPTISDPTLQVTWLANADLAATSRLNVKGIDRDGSMNYTTALKWVHAMNTYNHGNGYLGHTNWTLPITPTPSVDPSCSSDNKSGGGNFGLGCSRSPLASLYSSTLGLSWHDTAVPIPDTKTGPFHDFQPYLYWT